MVGYIKRVEIKAKEMTRDKFNSVLDTCEEVLREHLGEVEIIPDEFFDKGVSIEIVSDTPLQSEQINSIIEGVLKPTYSDVEIEVSKDSIIE